MPASGHYCRIAQRTKVVGYLRYTGRDAQAAWLTPPSYARRYLWVDACGNVAWISLQSLLTLPTQVMAGVTVTCGPKEIESFFHLLDQAAMRGAIICCIR